MKRTTSRRPALAGYAAELQAKTGDLIIQPELMSMADVMVDANLMCCQCGATNTPQWREGPLGPKTLCNACGVKYYRQAKRTRKGAMGGGSRSKARRTVKISPAKAKRSTQARLFADGTSSDDQFTTLVGHTHSAASGSSVEEIEERDAAMSLLCFAGVEPITPDSSDVEMEPEAKNFILLAQQPVVAAPATASAAALPVTHAPTCAPMTAVTAAAAAAAAFQQQPEFGGTSLEALAALLSAQQLPKLLQLQAAVQTAYKEAEAADAATLAVAQFLEEKQEEAASARVRVRMAEQLLLDEVRKLEAELPSSASHAAQHHQQLQLQHQR